MSSRNPARASFTIEEVEEAANDAQLGRVLTPVGAVQIETPVRRQHGQQFEFEQMKKISAWARVSSARLVGTVLLV